MPKRENRDCVFQTSKRQVLQGAFCLLLPSALKAADAVTPSQTEGPFYPIRDQQDKDLDLTRIVGNKDQALGNVIFVQGKVLSQQGKPVPEARVEIWQANKWGRYKHKRDPNRAPLDPNFQGWGKIQSNQDGFYRFKTIFPGIYPAGPGWQRPPHIHFKVSEAKYRSLTTQMYFPAEALNKTDRILQNLSKNQQDMLISREIGSIHGETYYEFNIVLMSQSKQ